MRGRRCLIAIPGIAGLVFMGAAAASAAPAHQAAARTVTASTADPYEFQNENALWIVGSTHGEDLTGSDGTSGTPYVQYSHGGGWYTYSDDDLCWNTGGVVGDEIAMDSCPSGDHNEWFANVPVTGDIVELQTYDGLCIWGAGNGRTLVLEACSASNNRDLWIKYSTG
jgi:hypothetical protein